MHFTSEGLLNVSTSRHKLLSALRQFIKPLESGKNPKDFLQNLVQIHRSIFALEKRVFHCILLYPVFSRITASLPMFVHTCVWWRSAAPTRWWWWRKPAPSLPWQRDSCPSAPTGMGTGSGCIDLSTPTAIPFNNVNICPQSLSTKTIVNVNQQKKHLLIRFAKTTTKSNIFNNFSQK